MSKKGLFVFTIIMFVVFSAFSQDDTSGTLNKGSKSLGLRALGGSGYGISYRMFLKDNFAVEATLLPPIMFGGDIDNAWSGAGVGIQWFFAGDHLIRPFVYAGTSILYTLGGDGGMEAGYGGGFEFHSERFFLDVSLGDVLNTHEQEGEIVVHYPFPGISLGVYF